MVPLYLNYVAPRDPKFGFISFLLVNGPRFRNKYNGNFAVIYKNGYISKTAEVRYFIFSGILYDHTIVIHTKFQIDSFKNDEVMLNTSKRF